jgi:hypothetical protein
MKYKCARLCLVVTTLAVATLTVTIPNLQAQSTKMKVNVPFNFHVGEKKLPAGAYLVSTRVGFVQLSDLNGHDVVSITIPITRRPPKENGHLVFSVYGAEYFLTEAQWEGYTTAYSLPTVALETEIAKNVSRKQLVTPGLNR